MMRELTAFLSLASGLSIAVLSHWLHWGTAQQVIWTATAIFQISLIAAVLVHNERHRRP